jgi:DNA-binding response OmpR family regulator
MPNKILVVDDEKLIVKGIKFSLEQDDMLVDAAYDGEEAVRLFEENSYDLIVLDVMLPKLDGFQVCQIIREKSDMPIIMVTAKGDDMDKILGLDNGADDYLTKPFNILELKARIKAILRRSVKNVAQNGESELKTIRDLTLEPLSRRVSVGGREANLTAKEFLLFEHLFDNAGRVYSREDLLNIIWGFDFPGDARTVDVHIRRLREKIEENPGDPKYIHTKWGVGYYFK